MEKWKVKLWGEILAMIIGFAAVFLYLTSGLWIAMFF